LRAATSSSQGTVVVIPLVSMNTPLPAWPSAPVSSSNSCSPAKREGIEHFALVHDSFGCLPSRAARFQGIIRETLVEMYQQHDVLAEVLERAKRDLSEHNTRLSEIEDKRSELYGNLNIKEVLSAKYAFA